MAEEQAKKTKAGFRGKVKRLAPLKYILGGVLLGLAMPALIMMVFAIWFFLPMELNWDFSLINLIVFALMPLLAGGFAGAKIGRAGMKSGCLTGFSLWFCVMALYFCLLPQLVTLEAILVYGAVCLFLGSAGGLCGVNISNLRKAARPKPEAE